MENTGIIVVSVYLRNVNVYKYTSIMDYLKSFQTVKIFEHLPHFFN